MKGCVVEDLKVHSQNNCYLLSPEQMQRLQDEVAVSTDLEPGLNVIKIQNGSFGYRTDAQTQSEPWVLLWIYGKVVNQATQVEVEATWSSLNGYEDTLTLDVREKSKLCAFFFDTHLQDNVGEITLSVAHL